MTDDLRPGDLPRDDWLVDEEWLIDEESNTDSSAPDQVPVDVGHPKSEPVRKQTSERKVAANRQNALNSTGPSSDEGKKASSRNAEKHGALSKIVEPIKSGRFAEDREAFYAEVDRLVESLAPVGAVEEAVAHRIAGVLIKLGRIDRWVVAVIDGEDNWSEFMMSGVFPVGKVASNILSGPMDLEYKYHQRAVRDLVTLLTELRKLQALRSTA